MLARDGPAPARAPRARAARERGRDGRGRVPDGRCRRQRRVRGPRAAPRARCAPARRARPARRLVRPDRRPADTPRSTAARSAQPDPSPDQPLTRSVELNDVRFGAGLVKLAAVSGIDRYVHLTSGRLPTGLHAGPLRGRPGRRHSAAPRRRVRHPPGRRRAGGRSPRSCRSAPAVSRRSPPTAASARSRCCSRRACAASRRCHPCCCSRAATAGRRPSTRPARTSGTIDRLLATEGRAEARLTAANGQFGVTAPDDALAEARSAGSTASRRVLLVGGAAAVLLLAFAGLTAGALRRDVRAELRRLGQRGATLSQQAAFSWPSRSRPCCPASRPDSRSASPPSRSSRIARTCPSAPRSRTASRRRRASRWSPPDRSARSRSWRSRCAGPAAARPSGVRPVDMAAVGAVVALALLLAGGSRDAGTLSAGPALTLAARPAARELRLRGPARPAARAGDPHGPARLAPGARHAPPGAAGPAPLAFARRRRGRLPRRLGRPGDVRALLSRHAGRSSSERAAYAVPLDYTLNEGAALVAPRDAASLADYRALAPGVAAWPVLRQVADAAGSRGIASHADRPGSAGRRPAAAARLAQRLRPTGRRPSSRACCDRARRLR